MAEIRDGKLVVQTPAGTLVAYESTDPNNPGIYIDLQRNGFGVDAPLLLTEYTNTEADLGTHGFVVTRVWRDALKEDYSDRIVHENIRGFFETTDENGNAGEYQ